MAIGLVNVLKNHGLPQFAEANPQFDLLAFDFCDPQASRELVGDAASLPAQLDALRAYQRLARLFPQAEGEREPAAGNDFERHADALIEAGFDSAHAIARLSKAGFARAAHDALDGNEALAGLIHRRAVQIKGAVRHLFANARDVAGSVHTRRMLATFADPRLVDYLSSIPSFQALFGSLDYIEVPESVSIFSPAAYFLDLLRINSTEIDHYDPRQPIPPDSLAGRRKDLFEMKIDADNTTRLVPCVDVVKKILLDFLERTGVSKPIQTIALARYPFDLPSVLPLAAAESALAKVDTSLGDIAQACSPYQNGTPAFGYEDALADLGLSLAQGDALTVRQESDAAIAALYGLDSAGVNLLETHPDDKIEITAGTRSARKLFSGKDHLVGKDRYIQVNGEVRRVEKLAGDEITVDVAWQTGGTFPLFTFGGVVPLNLSTAFCERTDLDYAGLARLLKQGLGASEVNDGFADRFFINAYAKTPMKLVDSWGNKKKLGAAPSIIENLPAGPVAPGEAVTGPDRLDRMSRFVRASRWLGLDFATLDWAIEVFGEKQLDAAFLRRFAVLAKLARRLGIDVADAIPFGGAFRTWGRGDGVSPADPFDRTFNSPSLDAGREQAGVFDPGCPVAWAATPLPAPGAKGHLVAVTVNTATLADDAWTEPNAYVNQSLLVGEASSAARSPVITAYDPTTRIVTFAEDWQGHVGSPYLVVNGKVVGSQADPLNHKWTIFTIAGCGWQGLTQLEGFVLTVVDGGPTTCAGIVRQVLSTSDGTVDVVVDTTTTPTNGASYTIGIDPSVEGRLAAALQIGKDALHQLWSYAFPASGPAYLNFRNLDVSALTWLWRLSKMARAMRVTIVEYILARRLAGLSHDYNDFSKPDAALNDAQRAVDILEFCKAHRFTPYEMDWAVHAGLSPFVKPGFDPNSTVTLLKNLASSAAATLLTPNALMQAGFDPRAAAAAIIALTHDGLIESGGAVTPPTARFAERSKLFPIGSASLRTVVQALSEAEADAALDALSKNRPPALAALPLQPGKPRTYLLQPAFDPVSSLEGVLTGCDNVVEKRAAIAAFLEEIADLILFGLVFAASALESNWISNDQALVVLDRLSELGIATSLAGEPALWVLASSWDGSTGGWKLFTDPLTPDSNKIASVDKADRLLQLETEWAGGKPNAATYLEILDAQGTSIWTGNADGGDLKSIRLPATFEKWDQLEGGSVHLLADPRAAEKTAQVEEALLKLAALHSVQQAYKTAVTAQRAAVANAAALALGTTAEAIASSLPYAHADHPQVRDIVPMFLGAGAPSNLDGPTKLLVTLSRIVLVRSKFALGDAVWRAMARRPALFGFEKTSPFSYYELGKIEAFEKLVRDTGAGAEGLVDFLETWPGVETETLQTSLHYLTGWATADISALSQYFQTVDGSQGFDLRKSTDLSSLARPFAIIAKTGAGAASIISLRNVTRVRLGPLGASPDADGWAKLEAARDLSLALVAGRYGNTEFAGVANELSRAASARERDALLSFLGWTFKKSTAALTKPSALSEHLLIDLEVSDCDTTSLIAQGITSVQLYMRRCRMGLEAANTNDIDAVWWDWMGSYRLWEANRRIFLYPENYLVPTQRKSASPEFKSFSDNIMQATPTDAHIASALVTYFHGFSTLADLVIVGAYKSEQSYDATAKQLDETTILVGRTHVTPYTYYTRTFARRTLPKRLGEQAPNIATEWEPWQEVPTKIKAAYVSPVWAFHRLFLFWSEIDTFKSSTISDGKLAGTTGVVATTTESWSNATLKYAYKASNDEWTAGQTLGESFPVAVSGYAYDGLPSLESRFSLQQNYFAQPLAQALPQGFAGPGTLTFEQGSSSARCSLAEVKLQLSPGDSVFVGGQSFKVASVSPQNEVLADLGFKFAYKGTKAPYRIVPNPQNFDRLGHHKCNGKVFILADTKKVRGVDGTQFKSVFKKGDTISFGDIERTVTDIISDTELEVAESVTQFSASADLNDQKQPISILRLYSIRPMNFIPKVNDYFGTQIFPGLAFRISSIALETPGNYKITTDPAWSVHSFAPVFIYRPLDFYVVYPKRSDERIFVCYGLNAYKTDLTPKPEDRIEFGVQQGSAYDDALTRFKANITNAKTIADALNPGDEDSGTVLPCYMLADNLLAHPATGWFPAYQEAIGAPGMLRGTVDQKDKALVAAYSVQDAVALYFGSVSPGTTVNLDYAPSNSRTLMYNIDLKTSYSFNVGNQVGWIVFRNERDSFFFSRLNSAPNLVAEGLVVSDRHLLADRSTLVIRFGAAAQRGGSGWASDLYKVDRLNTTVCPQLLQRLNLGIDDLLDPKSQVLSETPFKQYFADYASQTIPAPYVEKYLPPTPMDFNGAMGQYFWEVFYHAPMLAADWIKSNQDFERAKSWYEYIFDPAAKRPVNSTSTSHYWNFRPFRESLENGLPTLKAILEDRAEIDKYHDDPFDPHAIARLRISAYAKSTVIKYIENLIAWADALFTQDTREAIVEATGLYMLANDLLGPKPQPVGTFRQPTPMSFNEIWTKRNGDIPEFLIDLENSSLVPTTGAGTRFADVPMNDISAYFGVPENGDLVRLWTTIEDRLFKIRHCMNINGVVRQLALFAPPIDPAALLANLAGGGSLAAGGAFSPYPIPDTRFGVLVAFAKSMADEVIGFGQVLLGAIERKDGEALAKIRLSQEAQILQLATQIKALTVEQYQKQMDAQAQAQLAAAERQRFYDDLISQGLLPEERAEIEMMALAGILGAVSGVLGAAASVAAAFPNVGSPFAMTFGGQQLGPSLQNAAGWAGALSGISQTAGAIFATVGHQKRRAQEWDLQSRLAQLDVEQLATQIEAMQLQLQIAQRDLQIHNVQIAETEALQSYYESKFTNEALYGWMVGRLSISYFQGYSLALEFARMAQRAFQLEYRTETAFIAATYWDDLRKGLMAGEGLRLALSQLEAAYVRNSKRLQNVTKTMSLRALSPKAFLDFVRSGTAVIEFTEQMFDEDFPGQYMRRIVSLTVSIPALVGPYRNIHATLTQTSNRAVLVPSIEAVESLLPGGNAKAPSGSIESNVRVNQRISLSQGQGDTGVFVNDPMDHLYRPFEQTGAISSWKLSMPKGNNLIRYDAISDVIFELQYTAQDGGDAFRRAVSSLGQLSSRVFAPLILPAQQQSSDWSRFLATPAADGKQTLRFTATNLYPPGVADATIEAAYVSLDAVGTADGLSGTYLSVEIDGGGAKNVTLDPTGSGSTDSSSAPLSGPTASVGISFDLAGTPGGLKKNGAIDGAKLRDVRLILSISGGLS